MERNGCGATASFVAAAFGAPLGPMDAERQEELTRILAPGNDQYDTGEVDVYGIPYGMPGGI